ncbi:MAG TPA: glucosamine-6-phosphate deaminase [Bacillales bacterium]|nr:glucosamine-6-phosphate deaminase [Bacillales bacterium]
MKLIVKNNYDEMSTAAAQFTTRIVRNNHKAAIVPAMGNTPIGTYRELAEMTNSYHFNPSGLKIFQLDGYLGLSPNDPRSLERWLRHSVLTPWGIKEEQVTLLKENSEDPQALCESYTENVKMSGGFDLAILGLGPNGHLGFNEPPSDSNLPTRVVSLTDESIRSNAVYWGGESKVPRKGITAGMDLLVSARQILLLVSGEHKRGILAKTLKGPVTKEVPASFLQQHPNTTIITDKAAYPEGRADI